MTKTLISAFVLTAVLALPAAAAPRPHRAPVAQPTDNGQYLVRNPNVVTFGNRVIGQDPDLNVRAQMLHDPVPGEY